MKICTISFHSCPYSLLGGDGTGGMSVYLRELSAAITSLAGVDIDIFTRIQTPDLKGVKVVSDNVRLIHLKGGPESVIDRRHLYECLPEFTDNLVHFFQKEATRYDIIYSHYWLSGIVGVWLKHKFHVPMVHMYHTLGFLKNRLLKGEKEHIKRQNVEKELCSLSDAVVSSSWREKQGLMKSYGTPPSKVNVIYPGVNQKLFHPCSTSGLSDELLPRGSEKILLYVGRIEPVKGLMTVIHALPMLKHKNPCLYTQLKLVVIGGGQIKDLRQNKEYNRIKQFAADKSIEEKVVFLGSQKQSELKHYYSAADVLLVPSLYESFGLVVIEALACGTPVLVSRIGDMQTIVRAGQNGLTFQPDDPVSLTCNIEKFFARQQDFWDQQKISLDATTRFAWERTARETYRLFDELIKIRALSTTISPLGESPPLI